MKGNEVENTDVAAIFFYQQVSPVKRKESGRKVVDDLTNEGLPVWDKRWRDAF